MHKPWLALLLLVPLFAPGTARSASAPDVLSIGYGSVALNGPWEFHIGDDPRWAEPDFDDSSWEHVDLGAPQDATDGDVGITGYTSGWGAKGHPGYHGYAWYRLRFTANPPPGGTLALLGPWAVDSVYQVYANGVLLGGVGDFAGAVPTAHGYHYPKYFTLPADRAGGDPMVLAIRVWSGAWTGSDGGGIHVAPAIGERDVILARYRMQWLKIFEGYAVDAVPASLFALMALLSLCLRPFARGDRAYAWLAAALLLSGIQRGNQAFFFWWQIETIQEFVYIIIALVGSLSLAAWVMAWRAWFKVERPTWLPRAVAVLTSMLVVAQILGHPWVFGASFPQWASTTLHYLILGLRLAFLSAFTLVVYQGIRQQGREAWYALPAVLTIGAVLFAAELSALHLPGIWFPFGVGLSLSEICSVISDLLLAGLLYRRLLSYARSDHTRPTEIST